MSHKKGKVLIQVDFEIEVFGFQGSYEIKNTVFSELPSMVHFKGKFWCVVKLKTTTGEVKWCIDVILQLDED